MKIFISGNRSITYLPQDVLDVFHSTYHELCGDGAPCSVLVGDASGVDSIIQACSDNCVVYYSGIGPRNFTVGHKSKYVQAQGIGRNWHTYKDRAMGDDCDVHIGFVDSSDPNYIHSGTHANHRYVDALGKPTALICVSKVARIEY